MLIFTRAYQNNDGEEVRQSIKKGGLPGWFLFTPLED